MKDLKRGDAVHGVLYLVGAVVHLENHRGARWDGRGAHRRRRTLHVEMPTQKVRQPVQQFPCAHRGRKPMQERDAVPEEQLL